jgi:dynein heavy chain
LQPRQSSSAEGGQSSQSLIEQVIESLTEKFNDPLFDMEELQVQLSEEDRGPSQNVFLQEVDFLKTLVDEINRSLLELDNGLSGKRTKTARMEVLEAALFFNRVSDTWATLSYPSLRALGSWG